MKDSSFFQKIQVTVWTTSLIATLTVVGYAAAKQATAPPPSEADYIKQIQRLGQVEKLDASDPKRLQLRLVARQQAVASVDEFLAHYPKTSFKEEALIVKLASLADLARYDPVYLDQLLTQTERIARSHPTGPLAAENAFYAIQAFVLGARREAMAEKRRLRGTVERYQAFLTDYPTSRHAAVIRASLIRDLIALGKVKEARTQFTQLKHDFPNHPATRRAQGELYRVVAVGQPFLFTHTTSDGDTIRTADYLGKVLVIHFWATWSPRSMEQLPRLIDLDHEWKDQGLQLIGVNVDTDRKRFRNVLALHPMPWPQFHDEKGFQNAVLVSHGVTHIPTYFVVDRKGTLRSSNPGDQLRKLVQELLAEK